MGPPSTLPASRAKRKVPEGDEVGDGPPKKRLELGEDIPDEVSPQEIEHMLDLADDIHIEVLNEGALKRMVMQLERKIKNNQALRIKHADEPDKFLKSEVDLDEDVKKFGLLTTHPELYGELIKLEALPQLVGLLNHVNTDIAVDVFEVLSELTDPDVIAEVEQPEDFVKAVFDAQLCQMSVDVLLRIDENSSEEDAKAVTNCLTMMENLADISPTETCNQFAEVPRLLPWLIKRVRAPGVVDYNRVYAAEILGIVLQNSAASREAMVRHEGVDKLLRGIAGYRKRDPSDSEESEYVQNMFDCLCSLMLLPEHQLAFGKVQGLELMVRMMQQHNFTSSLAIRLADHAMRHCPANCQIFVEKLGLKVLFPIFMKKGLKLKSRAETQELEEHVTSIIQSLCRYCVGTAMARVLNKFTESSFEKLERLLEMHDDYARAVRQSDAARLRGQVQSIDRELDVDNEEQLFLDRCDAGLFTLQQVDIILVRLVNMGNRQAADEIGKLLKIKGVPVEEVLDTVEEYCSHLDDSAHPERDELQGFARALARRYAPDAEAAAVLQRRVGGGSGDVDRLERQQWPQHDEAAAAAVTMVPQGQIESEQDRRSISVDKRRGRPDKKEEWKDKKGEVKRDKKDKRVGSTEKKERKSHKNESSQKD